MILQAPFPYFGGKSQIASRIWNYLGNPDHYIEPFFGSGAVLLNRPDWSPKMTETVCDKNGFIANVWRSIQFSPEDTANHADWPINHADLMARKSWLIRNESHLLENLVADPDWHDPKAAGYWIWAASCWIGSGLTKPGQKRPHISNKGVGVHKSSLIGQIPHLASKGMGVHKNINIYRWFADLSNRLRHVRVVCGDFKRVLGGNWQDSQWTIVGIYFDPPYGVLDRDPNIYHHDSLNISKEVENWCLDCGKRNNYRIVISGYDSEYSELIANGWRTSTWIAQGGYSHVARSGVTQGHLNRKRETLFISPYCLNDNDLKQMKLFI